MFNTVIQNSPQAAPRSGIQSVACDCSAANLGPCVCAGLTKLMDNDVHTGPINIGNPTEFTMLELAKVGGALTI